jgi:hypothetical protein
MVDRVVMGHLDASALCRHDNALLTTSLAWQQREWGTSFLLLTSRA